MPTISAKLIGVATPPAAAPRATSPAGSPAPCPLARTEKCLGGGGEGGVEVEVLGDQGELAGLDLGEVQHVVQHRQQQAAGLADDRQTVALHGVRARPWPSPRPWPGTPLSGVRISWLILARNWVFRTLAALAWSRADLQVAHGCSSYPLPARRARPSRWLKPLGEAAEQFVLRLNLDGLETAALGHLVHGFGQPRSTGAMTRWAKPRARNSATPTPPNIRAAVSAMNCGSYRAESVGRAHDQRESWPIFGACHRRCRCGSGSRSVDRRGLERGVAAAVRLGGRRRVRAAVGGDQDGRWRIR